MRSPLPKVLLPLAGRALLGHVICTARELDPAQIHVIYGNRGDRVRAAFDDANDLDWVHQAEQRGTGHAVQQALARVPDAARVLVLCGDVPLIRAATLQPLVESAAPLSMLAAELSDPHGYGRVIRDAIGCVGAIVEETDCTPEQRAIRFVNTGILAADAKPLRAWAAEIDDGNAQGELYLTDVFARAAAEGSPASVFTCTDEFEAFGANDPWQLANLERRFQLRAARDLCSRGVRLLDPHRFDLRGTLTCGVDVEIGADVVFEGDVELGDGVRIGPFNRIRNCRLAAGTVVNAHCDLDGAVTHGPCTIGPFARLRPGTHVGAGARIGNFVEVKAADIEDGAKVNHLSYIGDARVGAGANIGAGTITCNYDGFTKARTDIGKGAFIGSNTALVAPVTVGDGAIVGAGSTLTGDVPDDAMAVARGDQRTVPGGAERFRARRRGARKTG